MGVACLLYTEQHPHLIMGKGQNEGGFSEEQVQMYKDCFKLMDINKDGTLDKNDLRGAFDNIGVLMSEGELDELMGEVGGPCNVMGMVNMFRRRWPEMATTPMSSSSRLSWPMTRVARSMSRCSSLRLMTSSMSLRSMRTTWSRPRRLLASLLLSRRKRRRRRRRKKLLLKLLQRRMKVMPRRRRRRRRRPPSK